MNLSALNFFRTLRTDNRQFAVIGLGRFGRAVCVTLHKLGYEVLGADRDEKLVAQVLADQMVSHAIQLDSTEPWALEESGIYEFDTVIIAIGNYIQESTITTLNVKEGGVRHVVAKASSEIHGKLLERVGADLVVYPEREMGCNLARRLTRPGMLDRFILDPDHSIVEVMIPDEFDSKTIAELNLRAKFGINVLAVGLDEKFEINPNPDVRLRKGLTMVVIGCNTDIDRLPIFKIGKIEKNSHKSHSKTPQKEGKPEKQKSPEKPEKESNMLRDLSNLIKPKAQEPPPEVTAEPIVDCHAPDPTPLDADPDPPHDLTNGSDANLDPSPEERGAEPSPSAPVHFPQAEETAEARRTTS